MGELPTTVAASTLQQKRWSKGFAQVAKKTPPRLRGSDFSAAQKRDALIHLMAWWAIPLFGLAAVTGIIGLFLQADSMPYMVAALVLALENVGTGQTPWAGVLVGLAVSAGALAARAMPVPVVSTSPWKIT
mgnify:CR=1 FL=1